MLSGRERQALEHFKPMWDGIDADSIAALALSADLYERLGNSVAAERLYRKTLQLSPQHPFATRRLAFLLSLQGRRRESIPLLFELLKMGEAQQDELLLLGNPRALLEVDELEQFSQAEPDNPSWQFAQARIDFRYSRTQQSLDALRQVVQKAPDFPDGQAIYGLVVLYGATDEFWDWYNAAPPSAQLNPTYWVTLGFWAQRHGQQEAAVRCFWEAIEREPTHRLAHYQLAMSLIALGKPELAQPYAEQAERLRELLNTIDRLFEQDRDSVEKMQQAADQLEGVGRYWEAWGWHRQVLAKNPADVVSRRALPQLQRRLGPDVPRVVRHVHASDVADFSDYPLPRVTPPSTAPAGPQPGSLAGRIRFADVAPDAGVDFEYFNGEDPASPRRRMIEFTGGGVIVLDYDQDGWPDLYFTQGTYLPRREGASAHRDQLFRNLGNGRFENVTERAGLGDDGYSQGASAGDFNSDGFPDLLVGNVGPNRLYRNNGDGTFSDVAEQAGIGGNVWTTSCMIADLNGDGLADLFEVNYLAGNVLEAMCVNSCAPNDFPAEQDRFYLNRADGTFVDQTLEAGFTGQQGKGLALAAFDPDESGQLSLFVANDTTANFFYVPESRRGDPLRVVEAALIRGLAFNREGQAQACMGIAVGDANGDELLDLYVANFYRDFNVLYEHMPGGFFVDVCRERGLAEPSYLLLAFGNEFIDVDLDGDSDLVVTNGHVDNSEKDDVPYHMPPQIYENVGGEFRDLGASCGAFFEGTYLGRGLAFLDWNRDGRGDWAISHLDSPAAILENRTEPCGHFLSLSFVGIQSHRDAIGTTCRVTAGGHVQVQQLFGGGGYHTCNEKRLLFGLGASTVADSLEVKWPSGAQQVFRSVAADRAYRLVEGDDVLYEVPRDGARADGRDGH
jgi:tetratricopeptide (TPR) repeat protein